jgi:hypothetical protein
MLHVYFYRFDVMANEGLWVENVGIQVPPLVPARADPPGLQADAHAMPSFMASSRSATTRAA